MSQAVFDGWLDAEVMFDAHGFSCHTILVITLSKESMGQPWRWPFEP